MDIGESDHAAIWLTTNQIYLKQKKGNTIIFIFFLTVYATTSVSIWARVRARFFSDSQSTP